MRQRLRFYSNGGADAEVAAAIAPDTTLPLSDIIPNKGQPRKNFDEQALEELADSIKQNGVLQPILVRKKGQIIHCGTIIQGSLMLKIKIREYCFTSLFTFF